MHPTGIQILNLMFREEETVCVSPNKWGYHSMPLKEAFSDKVPLVSPNTDREIEFCHSDDLKLVALNPIQGFRVDASCYKFRNFLVELDVGPLKDQIGYIKKMGMPYSASIFSGGKSIHFLISLDKDLPNEEAWRKISEWILAILPYADQNCKNPSRSIRIPGAKRDSSKQALVEYVGPVSAKALGDWLSKHKHLMPKPREKREINTEGDPRYDRLKPFARDIMKYGPKKNKGRNQQWFAVACEYALAGFSEDETLDILEAVFNEDRDFKKREWKAAIKSGFKHIYENRK